MIRGKRIVLLLLVTIVAVAGSILVLARSHPPAPLPRYGQLGSFALIDHTGAAVTPETLRGHVVIADFVFTRCDNICPLLSQKMQRIQEETASLGDAVRLISFSVDPAYDTPERLAAYARGFHADEARWRFATSPRGDRADLAPIAAALMSPMNDLGLAPSGAPAIQHSNTFFLLDRDLELRGYYDADDAPKLEKMLIHTRRLARPPP